MRFRLTSLFVCGAAATIVLAAQNPMRPGSWETTVRMEMTGMPAGAKLPEMKQTRCITAAQLAKDPAAALSGAAAGQKGCTASDY
jgi:hypothetical protein